jgi:hypothetical protein
MNNINLSESEKSCAEDCSERSYFLEWSSGEEKEVQKLRLQGVVPAVEQPSKSLQPSLCSGGWAPRATNQREAGAASAEGKVKDSTGLDQRRAESDQ